MNEKIADKKNEYSTVDRIAEIAIKKSIIDDKKNNLLKFITVIICITACIISYFSYKKTSELVDFLYTMQYQSQDLSINEANVEISENGSIRSNAKNQN